MSSVIPGIIDRLIKTVVTRKCGTAAAVYAYDYLDVVVTGSSTLLELDVKYPGSSIETEPGHQYKLCGKEEIEHLVNEILLRTLRVG
jgi:hypothetical protein